MFPIKSQEELEVYTIGGKQAHILDEVKVYYLPPDHELKFKKRATCVVHTAIIGKLDLNECPNAEVVLLEAYII